MPTQCEGRSRAGLAAVHLSVCPYDAVPDDLYCTFHRKVVDGLIDSIDGARLLSWQPGTTGGRKTTALDRLVERHDELDQQVEEWT